MCERRKKKHVNYLGGRIESSDASGWVMVPIVKVGEQGPHYYFLTKCMYRLLKISFLKSSYANERCGLRKKKK